MVYNCELLRVFWLLTPLNILWTSPKTGLYSAPLKSWKPTKSHPTQVPNFTITENINRSKYKERRKQYTFSLGPIFQGVTNQPNHTLHTNGNPNTKFHNYSFFPYRCMSIPSKNFNLNFQNTSLVSPLRSNIYQNWTILD